MSRQTCSTTATRSHVTVAGCALLNSSRLDAMLTLTILTGGIMANILWRLFTAPSVLPAPPTLRTCCCGIRGMSEGTAA